MHEDIHFGGVLISSFVGYALVAFAILLALRFVFARIRLSRYVANALAEAGIYVCVLALLIALT